MVQAPRRKLINGKPVSCRTCKFVMDSRFPLSVSNMHADRYRTVCCRIAPPAIFEWTNTEIEPFCGQHEPEEGTVPADPRLAPLGVRERVERAVTHPIFDDEAMISMYGAPVPPEKVPPGLRKR